MTLDWELFKLDSNPFLTAMRGLIGVFSGTNNERDDMRVAASQRKKLKSFQRSPGNAKKRGSERI
jgi:hypothetical protein